jgi:H/ACA ribonucleoprotein complex subunit 4
LETTLPWTITRELVTRVDDSTDEKYGCRPEGRTISQQIKYGIINVDKPAGPSSHEVVAWIKRMMRLTHAGHGGTLEAAMSG